MTKLTFDELRQLYAEWDDRLRQYHLDSSRVVVTLANRLSQYIGAPTTFNSMNQKGERRYIEVLKAVRNDDGTLQFSEPDHVFDLLQRESDGYWIAGIRLFVDRAENAYPKKAFTYGIRFALRDRLCEMYPVDDNRGGRFEFDIDTPENFDQVCEYMVGLLQQVLIGPPWSEGKAPIGFTPPVSRE